MPTINLKNIPEDVRKYILKIQGEIKSKKGTQYSQQLTIYQIIREHQQKNKNENY
jgi:hypothetical protein